jgi:ribosomal protein S18 acetylase RimI-like enzyme
MVGTFLLNNCIARNAKAIRFYEKQGFNDIGTQTFVLGADVQTDRVMARPLN